jgi:hypothetical protein
LDALDGPDHAWPELAVGAIAQEVHESHDGGERRAQLVRDIREELRLRAVGACELKGEMLELETAFAQAAAPLSLVEEKGDEGDNADAEQEPGQQRATPCSCREHIDRPVLVE